MNYHGFRLFDNKSATKLKGICDTWAYLISFTPQEFQLKGNFTWENNISGGYYEKISIEREKVIDAFKELSLLAQKLECNNCYIPHFGI